METIVKAGQDFYVVKPQITKGRELWGFKRMPVIAWAINPSGDVTAITPTGHERDAVVELPGGCGYTMTPGQHFDGMLSAAGYLEEITDSEMVPELLAELGG